MFAIITDDLYCFQVRLEPTQMIYFKKRLIALHANIRNGCSGSPETNTLAYLSRTSVTTKSVNVLNVYFFVTDAVLRDLYVFVFGYLQETPSTQMIVYLEKHCCLLSEGPVKKKKV